MQLKFKYAYKFLLVASIYYLAELLGHISALPQSIISPMWPASGVALAAVLIFGYSIWPAVFLSSAIFNFLLYGGFSPVFIFDAILLGIGDTLEPIIGAWLLKKVAQNDFSFSQVYQVFLFIIFAALIAPVINATIGTTISTFSASLNAANESNFYYDWFTWWLGDVIGIITITPAIVAWTAIKTRFRFKELIEPMIFIVLLLLASWMIFTNPHSVNYLFVPFAIWAALRFRIQIAMLMSSLISIIVIFGTIYGSSEFHVASTITTLLLVQGFIGVISITVLFISAVLSEREVAYTELRLINNELEQRVLQRTQDLAEKNVALNQAMSELKQTQAQLVQSEKMSSIGILAAGIAHEINNAVNFISANLGPLKQDMEDILQVLNKYAELDNKPQFASDIQDILKLKSSLDLEYTLKEIQQLLVAMQDGAERTTTIVKDLRTFSRLDENAIKAINVFDNIDSTLTLLKSHLKERITIIKHDGNIPDIECYPGKLNQVFMNLLMNAAQAIKDQGTIEITTHAEKETVTISIKDSGSGMTPEVLQKIFEPFYTTKDVGQGTGLGLWISYDIIQAHHGNIEVKSTPGQGSEFIITLPIKQPAS